MQKILRHSLMVGLELLLLYGLTSCNTDKVTTTQSSVTNKNNTRATEATTFESSDDQMLLTSGALKTKVGSSSNANSGGTQSPGASGVQGAAQKITAAAQPIANEEGFADIASGNQTTPWKTESHNSEQLDQLMQNQSKNLSQAQADALKAYSGVYFRQINSVMRGDMSEYTPQVQGYIDQIESAISSAPKLPKDLIVYRGEKNSGRRQPPNVGQVIQFPAFTSSSIYTSVAESFSQMAEGSIIFKIQASPGHSIPGIYLGNIESTEYKHEAEVLISKQAKFEVIKKETLVNDDDGYKTTFTLVTLRVIP